VAVAINPEEDRANRPHHKADTKHRKRRQQRNDRVAAWEEELRDCRYEIPISPEIVPFEDITDHTGGDGFAILRSGK
jgi:hypothetical protein